MPTTQRKTGDALSPALKQAKLAEAIIVWLAHKRRTTTLPTNAKVILGNFPAVSTRYIEPMLQQLVKVGVFEAKRGPEGGYCFSPTAYAKTPAAIFCEIGANLGLKPMENEDDLLPYPMSHVVGTHFERASGAFIAALSDCTIAQLCDQYAKLLC